MHRLGTAWLVWLLSVGSASAAPLGAPLEAWVPWVRMRAPESACLRDAVAKERHCAWHGRLALRFTDKGAAFVAELRLDREGFALLPGDADAPVLAAFIDRKPVPVVWRDGAFQVPLPAGTHRVEGRLGWERPPETLAVPDAYASVSLSTESGALTPRRSLGGAVGLGAVDAEAPSRDETLGVQVFRRLRDGRPQYLDTELVLEVAGAPRTVSLGRVLPEGFLLHAIESALPTELEEGALRLTLSPGTHRLKVTGRSPRRLERLAAHPADDTVWAAHEFWAFEADAAAPAALEGGTAVDPKRTALPEAWHKLRSLRVPRGGVLSLAALATDSAGQVSGELSLTRELWLDFDGGGWTAKDRLTGSMTQGTQQASEALLRLDAQAPYRLGRAVVDGEAQVVTVASDGKRAGLELSPGPLNLMAELRVEAPRFSLPVVPFERAVESVSGRLHLPPGWWLMRAFGPVRVEGAWLERWDLTAAFLALITLVATFKLLGFRALLLAAPVLALTLVESWAPGWLWIVWLAGIALLRAIDAKHRRTRALLRWATMAFALGATVAVCVFAAEELGAAMHPVLEKRAGGYFSAAFEMQEEAPAAATPQSESADYALRRKLKSTVLGGARKMPAPVPQQQMAPAQTGPGLPSWAWHRHALQTLHPVDASSTLSLWVLPPSVTRALRVLRALALLAWLALLWRAFRRPRLAAATTALLVSLIGGSALGQAPLPTPELLDELEQRLLAPPVCAPHCVGVASLELSGNAADFRLSERVEVAAPVVVTLPSMDHPGWPQALRVDGKAPERVTRSGRGIHLGLGVGSHLVTLSGALPDATARVLRIPFRPRRFSAKLEALQLQGRVSSGALTVVPVRTPQAAQAGAQAVAVPPFVTLTRRLSLGVNWELVNVLERASASSAPVELSLRRLAGETPASSEVEADGALLRVRLPVGKQRLIWRSRLRPQAELRLGAPDDPQVLVSWELARDAQWRMTATPPEALVFGPSGTLAYGPWPGEQLRLAVAPLEAAPGPSRTLRRVVLDESVGDKLRRLELTLALRTSQGGAFVLPLGEGLQLEGVTLDGDAQQRVHDAQGAQVLVPPGEHELVFSLKRPVGLSTWLKSTPLSLPQAAVNVTRSIDFDAPRWVLGLKADGYGSALRFWGLVALLVTLALGLRRLPSPLGFGSWLLLGLGLSQSELSSGLVIVGFFALCVWRKQRPQLPGWAFNLRQLLLAFAALAAVATLVASLHEGLLGYPDMYVEHSPFSQGRFSWYVDRIAGALPELGLLVLPLWAYKVVMFAWALWLAFACVAWARWSYAVVSQDGLWRSVSLMRGPAPAAGAQEDAMPTEAPTEAPAEPAPEASPKRE